MKNEILIVAILLCSSLSIEFIALSFSGLLKPFSVRLNGILSVRFIWRITRYSFVYYLLLLLLFKHSKSEYKLWGLTRDHFDFPTLTIDNMWLLGIYFLILIVTLLIIYAIKNTVIRKNLSIYDYKPVGHGTGCMEFLFSSIIINLLCVVIMFIGFNIIHYANNWFSYNDMYLTDWFISQQNREEDFKRGFYFSFLASTITTSIFVNAIFKVSLANKYSIKFFIFSCVIFATLLSALYSLTNSYYNLSMSQRLITWYQADSQIGAFALRVASLLLFYHVFSFTAKHVLKTNLINVFYAGISSTKHFILKQTALSDRAYSTTFICQVGFYAINVAIAEFSLIFQDKSTYLTIMNFALAFIVDDYIIIHNYSNKFNKILKGHKLRITIFNILLLGVGVGTLISLKEYFIAVIFFIVSIILAQYFYTNQNTTEIVD